MVDVICQDVEHDIGDGLYDLAICQTEDASSLQIRVSDFAALDDNAAREFQDRIDLANRRCGVNRAGDVPLGKTDSLTAESVRAQAVAAQVALSHGEGDLLSDLHIEGASGQRPVEIDIALECSRRIAEHAAEVWYNAEFGLNLVEEMSGVARRLARVDLGDAVQADVSLALFSALNRRATRGDRTLFMPGGRFLPNLKNIEGL